MAAAINSGQQRLSRARPYRRHPRVLDRQRLAHCRGQPRHSDGSLRRIQELGLVFVPAEVPGEVVGSPREQGHDGLAAERRGMTGVIGDMKQEMPAHVRSGELIPRFNRVRGDLPFSNDQAKEGPAAVHWFGQDPCLGAGSTHMGMYGRLVRDLTGFV